MSTELEAFVLDEEAVARFLADIRETQKKYNNGIGSASTEKFLALVADRDAKLAAVRELHVQSEADQNFCDGCDGTWPCRTARAVSHE